MPHATLWYYNTSRVDCTGVISRAEPHGVMVPHAKAAAGGAGNPKAEDRKEKLKKGILTAENAEKKTRKHSFPGRFGATADGKAGLGRSLGPPAVNMGWIRP